MERGSGRSRPALLDPAALSLVVASLAIYVGHGFNGRMDRDLSLYVYAGQRFADGVVPYDGVVNRSGPLSHIFPGIGIWLGRLVGADDVTSARVFFMLLSVFSVYLTYRVALRIFDHRGLALTAGITLLALGGFTEYASNGPREKTLMVVFLLLAMQAILARSWWGTGIWLSLATLTWQPVLFAGLLGALAGLVFEERGRRLRGLVAITLGGLAPLAAFLAWYAVLGKLQLFLDCFVLIHVRYTDQPPLTDKLSANWDLLRLGFSDTVWVLFAGLVGAVLVPVVAAVLPSRRRTPEGIGLIVLGAITVGGIGWSLRAFNGWPDTFIVVPSAALGLAAILSEARRVLPGRVGALVVPAWAGVAMAIAVVFSLTTRNSELDGQRERAEAVSRLVGPDATFWSLQGPGPLVLTGRVNPVRHQMFGLGLADYVDDTWPGGLAGLADRIHREQPAVLAVGYMSDDGWYSPLLAEDYEQVGRDVGLQWFVSRSLDPGLREEIRAALRLGPR